MDVVGDAAGNVDVLVKVVAGADAVVAIGDLERSYVDEVFADHQEWG